MPEQDPLRKLRHDIRGRLNALKLCTAVLETDGVDTNETLEFIEDIIKTTDKLTRLIDELDLYPAAAFQA
jgi:nitrogen-specific signal transduction histidine kinase